MKIYNLYILLAFSLFSYKINTKNITPRIPDNLNPIGEVIYIYKSKERQYLLERESKLIFNNKNSVFIHSRGKEPMVTSTGDKGQDGYVQDKIGNLIYKDFEKNIIQIRKLVFFQPYLSDESLPKFNWEITSKEKKIGKFNCRLAKTEFRGRLYNAWFTTEVPISDGPWKFHGLPGLILEVVDSKQEYQFLFKSISIPPKKEEPIVFIDNGKYLPFKAFIKADDLEFNKLRKKTQANWDGDGELEVKKPFTNPIELKY